MKLPIRAVPGMPRGVVLVIACGDEELNTLEELLAWVKANPQRCSIVANMRVTMPTKEDDE